MPGANLPASDALAARLIALERAVQVLATQQQFICTDSSDVERVRLGLLASGDFGLAVTDPTTSTVTEFLPVYYSQVPALEATTSGSYTNLTTAGPTLTATIGASGNALVTVNTYMGVNAIAGSQAGGLVGVSVDGAAPTGVLDEILYYSISAAAAVGIAGNNSAAVIVTGLSPGQHTFTMKYKTFNGGTVNFGPRYLQVRPI